MITKLLAPLILASTSSARRALMDTLGIAYRCVAPGVDEPLPAGTSAREAVAALALRKAQAVRARHPNALVLAADQLVEVDGRALGKPETLEVAREQLALLSGRTHEIVTAICLLGPGVDERRVDTVRLTLFSLALQERERYLALGEWKGCAGSYRIESRGQALFSNIEGDRASVQGLPMLEVVRLLRSVGIRFF